MSHSKFINISVAPSQEGPDYLYALDEEGVVWELKHDWGKNSWGQNEVIASYWVRVSGERR